MLDPSTTLIIHDQCLDLTCKFSTFSIHLAAPDECKVVAKKGNDFSLSRYLIEQADQF